MPSHGHAALRPPLFQGERPRWGSNPPARSVYSQVGKSKKNEEPKARMESRADEREPRAEGATAFTPPEAAEARAKEEPQVPRETDATRGAEDAAGAKTKRTSSKEELEGARRSRSARLRIA